MESIFSIIYFDRDESQKKSVMNMGNIQNKKNILNIKYSYFDQRLFLTAPFSSDVTSSVYVCEEPLGGAAGFTRVCLQKQQPLNTDPVRVSPLLMSVAEFRGAYQRTTLTISAMERYDKGTTSSTQ